jgi:Dyp-type peroxidase family
MQEVEWSDVQRLVLSGYPRLGHSAYVLWRFLPGQMGPAQVWLADLCRRLTRAYPGHDEQVVLTSPADPAAYKRNRGSKKDETRGCAVHLALTADGLRRLEIRKEELAAFSREFLEGMTPLPGERGTTPRRSNLLGDLDRSSPDLWLWGGWGANRGIDGMLLLYAADPPLLTSLIESEMQAMRTAAEPIVLRDPQGNKAVALRACLSGDGKEHFGFRDGISQPIIEGTRAADRLLRENPKQARISIVKVGEFVLGYANERDAVVSLPKGAPSHARNLTRNGTYLVFRQLEQDVEAFHDFVLQMAIQVYGKATPATMEWAASRMVGRWTNGEPLIRAGGSAQDCPQPRNDFLYHFEDRFGLDCPIGAHIRRANPRDSIGPDPHTALRLSKMHRIIRRGRPYGVRPRRDPDGRPSADAARGSRGMFFICLNADIAGQYEMIQHSWLNNAHFSGLYAGADPLGHVAVNGQSLTVQHRPVNLHFRGLKPFVTVRGGAYFFLPGIKALRALAGSHRSAPT